MFQLAERPCAVPNPYDKLVGHYTLTRTSDVLGVNFDYQFTYQHSACVAYLAKPLGYRYATLPAEIGFPIRDSTSALNEPPNLHPRTSCAVFAHGRARACVAGHVGLTIMTDAPKQANAIKFLQRLFGPQGVAIQKSLAPDPITPPGDQPPRLAQLPAALRGLVAVKPSED